MLICIDLICASLMSAAFVKFLKMWNIISCTVINHKYSASRLILFDKLCSLCREELSLSVILGGGCSGLRLRAFVKRTKWFFTYLRYWSLMTIVLIIFLSFDFSGIHRSDESCYCSLTPLILWRSSTLASKYDFRVKQLSTITVVIQELLIFTLGSTYSSFILVL